MQNLTKPAVLAIPFCATGDKNTIPKDATGSQLASLAEGFPQITQKPISEGGVPPEREDFNGALNLDSQFYYAFQNGWLPTFDSDVSEAIGGYPLNAVLWYMPTTGEYANTVVPLRSLVSNNTYNFNSDPSYIGTYWGVVGINTRANLDLSNLSQTGENHFVQLQSGVSQADVDYVVESYQNGTSWYRVYKSGWCEQGGYVNNNTDYVEVAFLKQFANTNYSIQATAEVDEGFTPTAWVLVSNKATTSVRIAAQRWNNASYTATVSSFYWEAKGYIS